MRITNDIDLKYKEMYDTIGLYEFSVKNAHGQNYTQLSDYATIHVEVEGDF